MSETYVCNHGTKHTAEEGQAAIAWAATQHKALKPGECWIKLYRKEFKK